MADITYQVIQKPFEERVVDAGCIYWNVDRSFFYQKDESAWIVYRKSILYYIIRKNTIYSYKKIADMFGFTGHQPVLRCVENIDAQKNIFKHILNDINQVQELADKLDADFITTSITLVSRNISINNS